MSATKHFGPVDPSTLVLYHLAADLSLAGDLAGLRKLWAAIVPEFKALWPKHNAQTSVEFEVTPYEKTFKLGWQVYERLNDLNSFKTGRKVLSPIYHSGSATEWVKANEWEVNKAPIHAAFLRILARFER